MGERQSCSACCGIFNLRISDSERSVWLQQNTERFLALDLSKAENIVAYRREREAVTLPQRIRDDIYVCPFVGFVRNRQMGSRPEQRRVAREPDASMRTGCLLHPQGSPHPQIGLWSHPQNFSFYGEGICLAYDCLAKERHAHRADFFAWAENTTVQNYGRLASDHTLHRALGSSEFQGKNLATFYGLLARCYERYAVVSTSFEDIEKMVPVSAAELCRFLAARIESARRECGRFKKVTAERFSRRIAALLQRAAV